MIQEEWSDPETPEPGYTVSAVTLRKLGRGDIKAGRRLLRTLIDVEMVREPPTGPVARPPSVRIATESDEPALLELLRLDHAENAFQIGPFDPDHVMDFIRTATKERRNTIGVIDGPAGPIGLVFLMLDRFWFAPIWHLSEQLLFVHPDHRRGRHDATLLQFARSFADDMTARLDYVVYLVSSVIGTVDVDRKAAIWGRSMWRAGGVFMHPAPRQSPTLAA